MYSINNIININRENKVSMKLISNSEITLPLSECYEKIRNFEKYFENFNNDTNIIINYKNYKLKSIKGRKNEMFTVEIEKLGIIKANYSELCEVDGFLESYLNCGNKIIFF